MQAVVLAGGLGTRMLPRTESVPKFLLEVAGRPFAAWQLEALSRAGFSEVVLAVGHLGDQVEALVGDGSSFGTRVSYAFDGPELLGTAGALRNALELLAPMFLVTYGDSFLPFDYAAPLRALELRADALGCMAVFENENAIEPSNTAIADGWVVRYDKRVVPDLEDAPEAAPKLDHIDYGATCLRREVIAALPAGHAVGLDVLQARLARDQKLLACRAEERFFEVGSPQGLADLERHLRLTWRARA